ncbi:MAG: FhaA domain-containing protein [Acidobacteriota bacterium]
MSEANPHLAALEEFLRETIKANYYLTFNDLEPQEIVSQLTQQLSDNQFLWVDNTVYVPNLLTVLVPSGSPDKLEEIEVIFNSVVFMKYLYEYMTEAGYKLFDFVKVDVEEIKTGGRVALKFYWPSPEEVREDFTVQLDKNEGKILEVYPPKSEIPQLARLTALNAETYRVDYIVTKQITYIGRLKNIIDKETGHMLRRNDFIFARHPDPMSTNSSVSRLHAKIVYMNGQFHLYDTGSANGTSITRNDDTINLPRAEHRCEPLQDSDILNFGSAQVRFQMISSEDATQLVTLPKSIHEIEETSTGADTTYRITREQIDDELKKFQ